MKAIEISISRVILVSWLTILGDTHRLHHRSPLLGRNYPANSWDDEPRAYRSSQNEATIVEAPSSHGGGPQKEYTKGFYDPNYGFSKEAIADIITRDKDTPNTFPTFADIPTKGDDHFQKYNSAPLINQNKRPHEVLTKENIAFTSIVGNIPNQPAQYDNQAKYLETTFQRLPSVNYSIYTLPEDLVPASNSFDFSNYQKIQEDFYKRIPVYNEEPREQSNDLRIKEEGSSQYLGRSRQLFELAQQAHALSEQLRELQQETERERSEKGRRGRRAPRKGAIKL